MSSPVSILLMIWAVITTVLVILLIYRSTLTMKEDDQLFLDQAETHMEQEHTALLKRIHRLQTPVRALGAASVLLILVTFGLWIWEGLNRM